jgi:hypothetical protein
MVSQFFSMGGGPEVYGGLNISRVVNIPFGLIRNVYLGVPGTYSGIRSLLRADHSFLWIAASICGLALVTVLASCSLAGIFKAAPRFNISRSVLGCGISLALLGAAFPLLY